MHNSILSKSQLCGLHVTHTYQTPEYTRIHECTCAILERKGLFTGKRAFQSSGKRDWSTEDYENVEQQIRDNQLRFEVEVFLSFRSAEFLQNLGARTQINS